MAEEAVRRCGRRWLRSSSRSRRLAAGRAPRSSSPTRGTRRVSLGERTGLGLTIVKDLVSGYFGGGVDLASEPGHGTTFTLTFPLAGGS